MAKNTYDIKRSGTIQTPNGEVQAWTFYHNGTAVKTGTYQECENSLIITWQRNKAKYWPFGL